MAIAPFLWVLRDVRPARGALVGFSFGLASFGALLWWIQMFGELAWGMLTVSQAGFAAAFGFLAPLVRRPGRPIVSALALAALWTVGEYLRGMWPLGGFTWGGLGVTQVDDPVLLPLATVAGGWGIAFVLVAVNALLVEAAVRGRGRRLGSPTVPLAVAAAVAILPGAIPAPVADGPELDLALLQVDVRRFRDLDPVGEDLAIAGEHVAMHAALGPNPPDLAVWGESALDPGATRDAAAVAAVAGVVAEVGAPTVAGAIVDDPDGELRNVNLVFDGAGRVVDRYAKAHLVPFGEFVPWRGALGWIEALEQIPTDKAPGPVPEPVAVEGLRFGSVICFENSFPTLVRRVIEPDVGFVLVTTNNASYGFSAASEQHLAQSRLRAVETGRPVVHAAISGISAFVDADGGILARTDLFEQTVLRGSIPTSDSLTPYVLLGDWVPWLAFAFVLLVFLAPPVRPRASRRPDPLPEGPRALVIVPTYDERGTIGKVIERLLALPVDLEVLVVDDGSPDGTAAVVRGLAATRGRVRLVERPGKAGLASAYALGFAEGLAGGFDLVVEMDADLSHDPDELPRLLAGAREHDLVIGSRYIPGGSVTNWGRGRVFLSRAGNLYARLALGLPVRDATSGYRVFRRDLLERLAQHPPSADGYGFQIELAHRAWRDGFDLGERPITFRERQHGRSKLSRRIVVEAIWLVTRWGLAERLRPRTA